MSGNSEIIASAITELSSAFLSNYFRALSEARVSIDDLSELSTEEVAAALAIAAEQNVEVIEYFAERLQHLGGDEWAQTLNALRVTATTLANQLKDQSVSATERVAKFVTDAADGLEVGIEGVTGSGRVVDALNRTNKIVDAFKLVAAVKDGDWGEIVGLFVGNFMGAVAGSLTAAVGVAIGAPALPIIAVAAVVAVAVEDFYSDKTNSFLDGLLGKTEEEETLAFMQRIVGGSGTKYLPTLDYKLYFGGAGNDSFTGNAGEHSAMLGGSGDDTLYGAELDDYLTGFGGVDVLRGYAGEDVLKGGADDDFLEGGNDSDQLEGGVGFDTYAFEVDHLASPDSEDVIVDSDGLGKIIFDGIDISGTGIGFDNIRNASLGAWETANGEFRLAVIGSGEDQSLL